MSLRIERITESKQSIAFYHKVADIPAGVTVKTSGLGSGTIPEATPLYVADNGLYAPAASAKVLETADASAVKYAVAKGSLFKVGDKVQKTATTSVNITGVDTTTDANKDYITLDATLGAKNPGDFLGQFLTGTPVAVTGEAVTFKKGDNVLVSAWVIAVVNKNIMPEPASKPAGVLYV